MSEDKVTGSSQRSPAGGRGNKMSVETSRAEERRATLRLVTRLGAVAAAVTVAFNILLYFQTDAWQMLAVAGGAGLAIACLALVTWLTRQDKFDAASYWALAGMLLAFALAETVHFGITPYLLIGGVLLSLVVGVLILPRKWGVWLATAVLYAGYVWLINSIDPPPLPRYDLRQVGVSTELFALALVVFLAGAAGWGLIRTYRRIVAIRTRLLVGFVVVVLLPVLIISAAGAVVGSRNGQQQAVNQLESVARIKEAEIARWRESLRGDLDAALAGTQVASRALVLLQSPDPSESQEFYLRSHLQQVVGQTTRFDDLNLLNLQGQVVLDTGMAREGQDLSGQALFQQGLSGFHLEPPVYSPDLDRVVVSAAQPVLGPDGQAVGVLAGSVNPDSLSGLMGERAWVGKTGELYLVDRTQYLLTALRFDDRLNILLDTGAERAALESRENGSGSFEDYRQEAVIGVYHWLPDLESALVAKQDRSEALAVTISLLLIVGAVALGAFAVAVAASLFITRGIAGPLANLTDTAAQIAAGDLTLTAPVVQEDEIGALARSFNSMTSQLRALIGSLERRVAERTRELERRSIYLQASAEVGHTASSVLDPDQLIRQVVELIRERFDLYYVGLFLVDEAREWAMLRAGTGTAGQAMLARGHRIRVGEGMVGWSVAHAQWRVAAEVGEDAVRLATPELPDTRSEAALPLRSRGRVLGALTVQDTRSGAFDQDTMAVLQTMADQVAVALDNADLFAESQKALEAERRAYGEISRQAWAQMIRARPLGGYRCDHQGISPFTGHLPPEVRQAVKQGQVVVAGDGEGPAMAVPIPVRDQVIGTLKFRKPGGEAWTQDEITLLEGMAAQLGLALEAARLYQDTQRRAARDRLMGEVTTRMRETLDMDTVLQTAVQEMRQALGLSRVEARMDLDVEKLGRATAQYSRPD